MSTEIPESYKTGIQHIEELDLGAMTEWLRAELHEQVHVLAGQAYDYPVQAIVNHHPYLSPETQKRMANAIEVLILDWKQAANAWSDSAVQALLSLAAELPVPGAKSKLQSLVESQAFSNLAEYLRPAVLGAIATLSINDDRAFWKTLPDDYPKFAGMAFQVLTRISHEDALELLGRLPDDQQVIGSVARKLPDFVSQFEPEPQLQAVKLRQISEALASLPTGSAASLKLAIEEAGFKLGETPSLLAAQQKLKFREFLNAVVPTVHPVNTLDLEYAT
jgi:hypothetical protein